LKEIKTLLTACFEVANKTSRGLFHHEAASKNAFRVDFMQVTHFSSHHLLCHCDIFTPRDKPSAGIHGKPRWQRTHEKKIGADKNRRKPHQIRENPCG